MNKNSSQSQASSFTVRRLHVNLQRPFDRHWNGGDAFRTAFANAMSMSFPVGEQFFIDAIKGALPRLHAIPHQEELTKNTAGFIGQEATHRFFHTQFNKQLHLQGYQNRWEGRAQGRIKRLRRKLRAHHAPEQHLHELAVTCAVEHLTAVMGDAVMVLRATPDDWFGHAQEPVRTMWYWHCAEEAEHKSLAFDVYLALGGNEQMRVRYFSSVLVFFVLDLTLQVADNLWRDGSWKRPSTWRQAAAFLLGRRGVLRMTFPQIMAYRKRGFHPVHLGQPELAQSWLKENELLWTPVHREVAKAAA